MADLSCRAICGKTCNVSSIFFGTYFLEEQLLSVWQQQAKGAKVIFDVGANLGIYSFAALAVEPNATVHAFEPTPEIANQLRDAAALNGLSKLNVHEVAVSSITGHAKLNRYRGHTGTNGGIILFPDTPAMAIQTVCRPCASTISVSSTLSAMSIC